MSIIKNGVKTYEGCVIKTSEKYWLDGMLSEYTHVWDNESQEIKVIQTGYYGSDCYNMYGNTEVKIDLSIDNARQMLRLAKQQALNGYEKSVIAYKKEVKQGSHVEVIKGRKIPKGTKLQVFWIGEKSNYMGTSTELIAGCKVDINNKDEKPVWIKAEYLKVLDIIKSPDSKNRKMFIKNYMVKAYDPIVYKIASIKEV